MPDFTLALETAGQFRLPVLRRGDPDDPLVVFVQPLFEEMNRCRRFIGDIGDALAAQGISSALPDLPATGDHPGTGPFDMAECIAALTAFTGAQSQLCRLVALRGGALLVPSQLTPRTYALAPVSGGNRLLTDLVRAHAAGERERTGGSFARADADAAWQRGETVSLAGYPVSAETAAALVGASVPMVDRVRRIGSGADELPAPPVWLQADPVRAPQTASAIADDIASWMAR